MPVSVRVQKLIWGEFAGRCALCRKSLVHSVEDGISSLLGEIAHIVGEKESAARGRAACTGSRNDPENLILLCREHHKIVDDHESLYPADRLRKLRADHLAWLEARLKPAERPKLQLPAALNLHRTGDLPPPATLAVSFQP